MGARRVGDSFDSLVVALCADFERRERAIGEGKLAPRVEMEYRYFNHKIYNAAAEVVGASDALLYIADIGSRRGYAYSRVEELSDTTYKKRKAAVFNNIATSLYLV